MNKILIFIFLVSSTLVFSQEKTELKVYSFPEVEKLHKETPKPIVVFIHTDWCKICHGMEQSTFADSKVIKLLNESFYFVKLNGEEKKDITFLGRTFVFKPTGNDIGTHELATELGTINNQISYPTTTFLDINLTIITQLNGYIERGQMKKGLKKIIEDL